ncbi:DUF1848 domain-containing protein [Fusibacter ferrireducens]|uniref:DUF1848 domain-containing protein n=1 Tax=Fusibacter ferrireducens TaxID=2785058 RepID=A0ABR9ZM86_9FIRM|nr:DUF1848 domain-containing protein [Fusibacter ferrireducens]MBF4691562.1 DUF1848 domain-containing protein [Fusibacter ferrireducens]
MIISISRRTDIPAFHTAWLIHKIKVGHVYVRNPMNPHQVSKVSLKPKDVACIVFWTKNPLPLLNQLEALREYKYYFQFTLNAYGKPIEKNLPDAKSLIEAFKQLSNRIGKNKVIWRYDPILLSQEMDLEYHVRHFRMLANELKDYTERCIISFIDVYPKIRKRLNQNGIRGLTESEIRYIAERFSNICRDFGIELQTCSEAIDLNAYNIKHGKCIDDQLICRLFGYSGEIAKDKNQRVACGCVKSVDIGAYNTCYHDCVYCYACFGNTSRPKSVDIESLLLNDTIGEGDKIYERKVEKLFTDQLSFF